MPVRHLQQCRMPSKSCVCQLPVIILSSLPSSLLLLALEGFSRNRHEEGMYQGEGTAYSEAKRRVKQAKGSGHCNQSFNGWNDMKRGCDERMRPGRCRGQTAVAESASVHGVAATGAAQLQETDPVLVLAELPAFWEASNITLVMGPVEAAPEYRVIVDANNLTVEIENELNIIHKFIRDKYSKRFPELESLVPNALDYIRTVKELGNSLDKCKNNENLQQILTNATIMVVSVTASTTQGQQLSEEELERLEEACDMALELNASKHRIYEYVESRMSFIAPNLSIIIGASTAAKIMGVAGGLTNLSKMPACNIMLLGAQRKTLSGFSSTSVLPHTGYIYHSDIVQSLPPDLRRKAARLVAAKCTLAARVDSFHESTEGKVGYELKDEIERKFDKWQEPPPVKQVKPLPAPLDGQRKKRGGRRYRKMKERLGLTEIRKQANRMSFGEIEEDAYQEDLGFSLGHLGKSGSGRVRQTQVNEATKARISKTLQRTLQKQSVVYGGKSTIRDRSSGTASSVAFTPLQGLEIVNPQAAEKKVAEANQKYFSSMAEFLKVKGEKSGIVST